MERRDTAPASDPSGRCPACGAFAPVGAASCPACGEPLAASADDAPLPPLPDGGLAALMPAWLRDAPGEDPVEPDAPAAIEGQPGGPERHPGVEAAAPASAQGIVPNQGPPAGAREAALPARTTTDPGSAPVASRANSDAISFDPARLIAADDLPAWLRAIGAAAPAGQAPAPADPAAAPRDVHADEAAAVPVYLPRAEAHPAAGSAAAGDADRSAADRETAGPAIAGERAPVVATADVAERATGTRSATPPPLGDDGAPPTPAEIAESEAVGGVAHAEVLATTAASTGGSSKPAAAQPDPARDDGPGPVLEDGVAAGIATIAILIVAAAILFLVWRALAGQ